ncbi:MAG: translocation/assembly module TamB domain-containing protein [Bacteroidales bacterium]|nr:translocation/assembly module TamB domain-containing protein [Bacteroidales bacterium]
MKKVWKIVSRLLLGLALTVYVVVALVNYSVVQSFAGAVAGNYFSKEWGCELSIGSLHAMPFDHLILDHVLWVAPDGDTLFDGEKISVTFNHFPFDGNGLDLERVQLKNAYYHFATTGGSNINLKFLIDYYKARRDPHPKEKPPKGPFTVKAKTLILDNVHYKMDLPDNRQTVYPYGVQIPHMEFFNINAKIRNVLVMNDDVTCNIVRFATRERSGFTLKDMRGDIHVSPYEIVAHNMRVVTGRSTIVTDAELHYDTWKGMKGYVSTVQHQATLKEGTHVAMSDVAYWAPVLWGIEAEAEAEGSAWGTIDSLTTDMMVRWGESSTALVAGRVRGLPTIDTTDFDVNIEHLRTNAKDMEPLTALAQLSPSTERMLEELGTLNLSAEVRGGIRETASVNLLADCRLGQLRTDATLRHTPGSYRITLDAGSDGMGLGLLRTDWITRTGFSVSVNGQWPEEHGKWRMERGEWEMEGELTNSVVKGHLLSTATLDGTLKEGTLQAHVESSDSLADMSVELTANLGDSTKSYRADVEVDYLDLGILPRPLATSLTARLRGNTLEEMSGTIKARQTEYGKLRVKNIDLAIENDEGGKDIELESDLADVNVRGQFKYSDLPLMAEYFGRKYLPEMFGPEAEADSTLSAALKDKTMAFQLRWLDDGSILHGLAENLTIARGTRVDGSYNFGEQMKVVALSDSIVVGSLKLENVGVNGRSLGDHYILQLEAQSLNVGKMELLERGLLTLNSSRRLATAKLVWGNTESTSMGDIMLGLDSNEIRVMNPLFYVGDTPWTLSAEGLRLEKGEKLGIAGERIGIESAEQKIGASLSLMGQVDDHVDLDFRSFSLDLLSDLLLQESPLDIRGNIDGNVALRSLQETPYLNANLKIDSCAVNRQELGEVLLSSSWNSELNLLNLQMANQKVDANGWVELGKEVPGLNIDAHFRGLQLAMVEPVVRSFSSHVGGELSGDLSLTGNTKEPMIVGDARVADGELKIDITGVTYHTSDSLLFENNTIHLKNFVIDDRAGNEAIANGTIRLDRGQQLLLDLGVRTDNLMVLDQKSGEQFYGKLFASADGRVTGPVNHLDIAVRARTNPGCELTVPISYQQSVKTQNYIAFINDEPLAEIDGEEAERRADFDLELDLSITPDVKLNLPMDFKEVGVNVGATGAGDLHLNLSAGSSPQVIGNYEINSGQMKVGLFSVYEKRFTIENGSSLIFQGNVPDARFDMQAVYSQRVNLSTLTGNLSSVDNTQKYLQVENVIAISGTLQDPTIGFDIRLPNADQSVEEEVFAYIDRNSERDMLNQTISLLINGSFYNVNSDNTTTGGADALGAVTSFVGNSLTDMVQFVDVNIDYKSANEYTNQQLDVNISKDWGRWYLESTLGYGGESRELEASSVNGAVIDALIGYRLSPMFHLFAYNRTNTNDYTRIDLPYKQGAGLKLTKDFDRWSDLFKRKNKKKK